jgi:hypothetical protein
VFSAQIFQENTFLETKPNFSLPRKCFPLTNFLNNKQTHESLEHGFPEITFRETNIALMLRRQELKNIPNDQALFPYLCSKDSGNPHDHPKRHNFLHPSHV